MNTTEAIDIERSHTKQPWSFQFSIVDLLWVLIGTATLLWILMPLRSHPWVAAIWVMGVCLWMATSIRWLAYRKGFGVAVLASTILGIAYVTGFDALWVAALFCWGSSVAFFFLPQCSIRTAALIGFLVLFAFQAWVTFIPSHDYAEVVKARAAYPFADLSPLLSYESDSQDSDVSIRSMPPQIQSQLDYMDDLLITFAWRTARLQGIHNDRNDVLLRLLGFGRPGLEPPSVRTVQIDPLHDIPFEAESKNNETAFLSNFPSLTANWDLLGETMFGRRPGKLSPEADMVLTHQLSTFDFLHAAGWGFSKNRLETAGFVPHAFHHPVRQLENATIPNQLKNLSLVSFERFASAKVYLQNHLPRMDQLEGSEVETRPLDTWESSAMQKLKSETDFVFEITDDRVRMAGALRACDICLNCHRGPEGKLLGAFLYEFVEER